MTFIQPGIGSTVAFLAIALGVAAAFKGGIFIASRRLGLRAYRNAGLAGAGIVLWVALTSVPVATGFLEASPFPRLPIFFLAINAAAVITGLTRPGKILATLPWQALVGFQAFRLPLELVLHEWAKQGSIPVTMTWTGANFDVLAGIAALVLAPFAARRFAGRRWAAWTANIVGLALLINVGRVAMLSSPLPFAWKVEPPLQVAFHLPYAWIAPLCVAGALLGHVVLTRALLGRR